MIVLKIYQYTKETGHLCNPREITLVIVLRVVIFIFDLPPFSYGHILVLIISFQGPGHVTIKLDKWKIKDRGYLGMCIYSVVICQLPISSFSIDLRMGENGVCW